MLQLCAEQAAARVSSAQRRAAQIAEQLQSLRDGVTPDRASLEQAGRSARNAEFRLTLAHRRAVLVLFRAAMTQQSLARRLESGDDFLPAITHWERAEDLETWAFAELDAAGQATDPYVEAR